MTGALERRVVPILLGLVILVWGAAVGLTPIRSFDYWWHLRTGELIAETGHVPKVDPYSYTVPGARWIDLHWLFQLGLDAVHGLGGHEGVRLAKGLAVVATLAAASLLSGIRARGAVTGIAVVLLALMGSSRFMARPDLPSFLLLLAVLALLFDHEKRGGLRVLLVIPLQLLWANLHGLFAVGLVVCAMALAAECLRPWVHPGQSVRAGHAGRLAAVLGLSTAASLLNPNGWAGALFPLVQLGMIGSWEDRGLFGQAIVELRPSLELGLGALWPVLLLAALAAAGWVLRRREASTLDLLLWIAFGYLALTARRNLALFAVVAVPLVGRNLGAVVARRVPATRRAVVSVAVLVLLAVGGVAFAGRQLAGAWQTEGTSDPALMPFQFPEAAVDWLVEERPPGPLYHRMGDGGYVIARLYPQQRVMVDGRLEVYGPREFARLEAVDGGTPAGFARLDAQYRFGAALLHNALLPDERLLAWLWQQPGWRLVHVDEVASVFVRSTSGRAGVPWPEVDVAAPDLFPPLDGTARPALDLWRRQARIRIWIALGQRDRALALAEETLERQASPTVEALRDWLLTHPEPSP